MEPGDKVNFVAERRTRTGIHYSVKTGVLMRIVGPHAEVRYRRDSVIVPAADVTPICERNALTKAMVGITRSGAVNQLTHRREKDNDKCTAS